MSLLDDAYALLVPAGSLIGSIIPDVVVSEGHQDAVAITDHPVEIGASITDHAFLLPSRLEMRIGFSDSSAGYVGYSRQQYEAILALMARREPFDVFTSKRAYTSMLVETVTTDTTDQTTNAAMIVVRLRRVLIASARGGGGMAPNASQASPETTGSVADVGTVQPSGVGNFGLGGPLGSDGLTLGNGGPGFGTTGFPGADNDFGTGLGLASGTGTGAFVGAAPGSGGFGLDGAFGNAQF